MIEQTISRLIMPKLFVISIFWLISVNCLAQDTVAIPKGIVYKKASTIINDKAKNLIIKELTVAGAYELFDSTLIIGPSLWDRYSKIKKIAAIKGGNITLKVTSFDSKSHKSLTELVAAKLIQRKSDYAIVVDQVIKEINKNPLNFRKLNEIDLHYYWSMTFFDIEEPIFIVEVNRRKFLIDIDNNKIKWLDEVL